MKTGIVGQSVLRACLLAADVEEVAVLVRSPLNRQHTKLKQLGLGVKRHDGG